MNEDTTIYTATMANIYAGQGHFEKASRIYRYLLDKTPGREDYKAALNEIETKLNQDRRSRSDRLAQLLGHWISLMNRATATQKLAKLRDRTF